MVKLVISSTERKPIPKLFLTDQIRTTVANSRLNVSNLDKLINGDLQYSTGQVLENYFFFICFLKLYLMFVKNFRSDVRTDFLVYHILMDHVTKLMLPVVIVYDLYNDCLYPRLYKVEFCKDQLAVTWKRLEKKLLSS
jgi:hypothetical protein